MKRFLVAIPKDDGGVELHPMKEWLLQHAEDVPIGLDATGSTSHQLRNGLKHLGWSVQELDTEVRLIRPSDADQQTAIVAVLGGEDDADEMESEQAFGLEHQLRDFLAQNIETITIEGARL